MMIDLTPAERESLIEATEWALMEYRENLISLENLASLNKNKGAEAVKQFAKIERRYGIIKMKLAGIKKQAVKETPKRRSES